MALHKARIRYLPAEFRWCPGCTWHRQRWCPGRSRAPQPHQTQVPGSVRSCSRSHPLSERAEVGPSQTPVTPSASYPRGQSGARIDTGPAPALSKMQSSTSGHTCRLIPQGPGSQVQWSMAQVFPGHQTGAGAPGTWAIPCSILPEEPLELGCQDQWSRCGSRMINSFNYTPCWAVRDVPSLAQLTAPQGSAGLACSGGGIQGTPRPDLHGASGGAEPTHSSVPASGRGRAQPIPSPWHPARPAPILLPCVSRLPAASPVWRREEPRLAALAAICTSRLWGRVAAPAPRSPGPWGSRSGWWQKAGERLAAPGDALWEKPLQAPHPAGTSCPHTWHTHRHGLSSTWHHTVGGDGTHGNGRQHRLREETQCGLKQSWAEGQGSRRESWGHDRTWGSLGPH